MSSVIDSHCHLDRTRDLNAALDCDLRAMITVGTDPDRSRTAVRLAESDPRVFAAVGVHPNEASRAADASVRAETEELLSHPRVVAVGETGFDDHWKEETLETQRRAFDWHAERAAEHDLPLILHVRDAQGGDHASRAAVRALRDHPHLRGVLHCCNGHEALLEAGLELGWTASFAGNLTYKNAADLRRAAARVPEDRLMVETDAPFLAPVPHRGESGVPAWVHHTARVLAETREVPLDRLEEVLDANAIRTYRLPL